MKKETKLTKIIQSEKFYNNGILDNNDIILDSIKAYGVIDDLIRRDIDFLLRFNENGIQIEFEPSTFKAFDYVLVCYDIVKNAVILTVSRDDYNNVISSQDRTYEFSLSKESIVEK